MSDGIDQRTERIARWIAHRAGLDWRECLADVWIVTHGVERPKLAMVVRGVMELVGRRRVVREGRGQYLRRETPSGRLSPTSPSLPAPSTFKADLSKLTKREYAAARVLAGIYRDRDSRGRPLVRTPVLRSLRSALGVPTCRARSIVARLRRHLKPAWEDRHARTA